MPDLDTQLRNLADHRAAQVPEHPVADEPVAVTLSTEPERRTPRGRYLVAAAIFAIAGVFATWWAADREPDNIVMFDPAPLPMEERLVVERSDWTMPLSELETPATFVVASVNKVSEIQAAVPERADVRYRPASTFKLLNALLFQETGVASDLEEAVAWDGVEREIAAWNQDHTLASAIEVSAVWVFEELSHRMDAGTTADLVTRVGYGNADIGDAIGAYWLEGALRISAIEQLAFLEDLYWNRLPLDADNQADLVAAMTSTEVGGATIRYKTGTALAGPDPVAWLVGIVEPADGAAQVFAFNADLQLIDGEPQGLTGQERVDLVVELLTTGGIIG